MFFYSFLFPVIAVLAILWFAVRVRKGKNTISTLILWIILWIFLVLFALVLGVFTVTDLVRAIANNKEDLLVGDLMTTNIVIVNEDMRIANAIEIMLKKAISRVLIADNDNNLLGIVTRTDLINSITNLSQFPIITQ